MQGED